MISQDKVTRELLLHIARRAGPGRIAVGIGGSRGPGDGGMHIPTMTAAFLPTRSVAPPVMHPDRAHPRHPTQRADIVDR